MRFHFHRKETRALLPRVLFIPIVIDELWKDEGTSKVNELYRGKSLGWYVNEPIFDLGSRLLVFRILSGRPVFVKVRGVNFFMGEKDKTRAGIYVYPPIVISFLGSSIKHHSS